VVGEAAELSRRHQSRRHLSLAENYLRRTP
jgi:hypothetical protein